ncbi:hypothetical protein JCM8097_000116 [Rhodosporidiobolus ruineniae]
MLTHALRRTSTASLRLTTTTTAAALRPTSTRVALDRGIATTSVWREDPGEGVGEKKPVGGDNPISARLKGVGKAAKSVAEGTAGIAEKAVGEENPTHHAGPDARDVQHQEQDKGKKAGLAHKGEQQGAI